MMLPTPTPAQITVVVASSTPAALLAARLLRDAGASLCFLRDAGHPPAWARGEDLVAPSLAQRAGVRVTSDDTPKTGPHPAGHITLHLPSVPADHALRGRVLSDAAVGALCGLHDEPLRRAPHLSALAVPSTLAALWGVNGVLAALRARDRDGRGQTVEVNLLHAAVAAQELGVMMSHAPPSAFASLQWAASPYVAAYRALDGHHVMLHLGLAHHRALFLQWLEHHGHAGVAQQLALASTPATRNDPLTLGSVAEARATRVLLAQLMSSAPAQQWEDVLSAAGLCAAVVRSTAEAAQTAHVAAALQDPAFDAPQGALEARSPWVAARGPITSPPLDGVRVLDLSQVIAGPVAARTLAELGATVTRVDNPRLTARWAGAFHLLFNAGKHSVTLDLQTTAGTNALWAWVKDNPPDVVLHNWGDPALRTHGLDEVAWRAHCPNVVLASVSAFGARGGWAGRPGWEQTVQAALGVMEAHGGAQRPLLFPHAVHDLATGLLAAASIQVALRARTFHPASRPTTHVSLTASSLLLQAPVLRGEAHPPPRGPGWGVWRRFYKTQRGWVWLEVPPPARLEVLAALDLQSSVLGLSADVAADQVAAALAALPAAHWVRVLDARWPQVVCVPRASVRALLRGTRGSLWERHPVPGVGAVTVVRHPLELSRTPVLHLPPPPPRDQAASTTRLRWLTTQLRWAGQALRARG